MLTGFGSAPGWGMLSMGAGVLSDFMTITSGVSDGSLNFKSWGSGLTSASLIIGGLMDLGGLSAISGKAYEKSRDFGMIERFYGEYSGQSPITSPLKSWENLESGIQFLDPKHIAMNKGMDFAEFLDSKVSDWSIATGDSNTAYLRHGDGREVAFSNRGTTNPTEFRAGKVGAAVNSASEDQAWRELLESKRLNIQTTSAFILNPIHSPKGKPVFSADNFLDTQHLTQFLDSPSYGKRFSRYMGYANQVFTPRQIFQAQRSFWEKYGTTGNKWVKNIDAILKY